MHQHSPPTQSNTDPEPLVWDLFCRVIDNFGDIGVCWRLCADLALRGHTVRLWIDDPSALQWMAPGALEGLWAGIQVLPWTRGEDAANLRALSPSDVWVEGFGCELPEAFVADGVERRTASTHQHPPVWINLEYLSAENFVERSHGLASPVMSGPARGWSKYFYFPGFTASTGGLLREPDLLSRQALFDRETWLSQWGVNHAEYAHVVSLFCYEPPALKSLLDCFSHADKPVAVLVTAGRATHHTRSVMDIASDERCVRRGALTLVFLPQLTQIDFDHLLWASDFNCVRGEDSVVRALWAGKPFLWQLYPQSDDAHHAKLAAFLQLVEADAAQRQLHALWNGVTDSDAALDWDALAGWAQHARVTRARLAEIPDLVSALLQFVNKKR